MTCLHLKTCIRAKGLLRLHHGLGGFEEEELEPKHPYIMAGEFGQWGLIMNIN